MDTLSGIIRTASVFTILLAVAKAGLAVEIIAHRGASFDAPENTLAAVNLAWKRNADAVEIDVTLSRDGKIVVVHDETTKRYGGPNKKIVEQTLAELKRIDVGTWKNKKWADARIPTLSQVLRTIPEKKRLFIEIKCGVEIIPELKRVIRASGKKPRQIVCISFSLPTITAVKRALPKIEAAWIIGLQQHRRTQQWTPSLGPIIRKTKAAFLDGVDLSAKKVIDRKYVDRVRKAGLHFYVWTVDSQTQARKLIDAGVEGITTNRPGRLRKQLTAKPRVKPGFP